MNPAELADPIPGDCGPGLAFRAPRGPGARRPHGCGRPARACAPKGPSGSKAGRHAPSTWRFNWSTADVNRPDPDRFRTWFSDRPELSPAVAWSAATLCGLLRGYRRLDTSFRGKALQRELVSIHAMRLSGDEAHRLAWPSVTENAPTWRRDGDLFVLSWDGRDFSEKPAKARGRWYTADLTERRVRDAALTLARGRHWPCVRREIAVEDDEIALSGRGDVEVRSGPRRLVVRSGVRMRLPRNAGIETTLDDDAFRRAVATESGPLHDPPAPAVSTSRATSPTSSLDYS